LRAPSQANQRGLTARASDGAPTARERRELAGPGLPS
jgi:hypothetical protein